MDFGERIRTLREEKGMTQQKLADQLFVTRQTVSRWENGSRYPDIITAKSLAIILDTSLDALMAGEANILAEQRAKLFARKAGKVETMAYALCLVTGLITFYFAVVNMTGRFGHNMFSEANRTVSIISVIEVMFYIFASVMLMYGMVKTIRKELPVRNTGAMGVIFFVYRGIAIFMFILTTVAGMHADDRSVSVNRNAINNGEFVAYYVTMTLSVIICLAIAYVIRKGIMHGQTVNSMVYVFLSVALTALSVIDLVMFKHCFGFVGNVDAIIAATIPFTAAICVFYGIIIWIGVVQVSS